MQKKPRKTRDPLHNQKIGASLKATRAKRKTQKAKTRELKIADNRLTVRQQRALKRVFLEAKWFQNDAIGTGLLEKYNDKATEVPVHLPGNKIEIRPLRHLGSHMKQSLLNEFVENKKSLAALKRNGHKIGPIGFKKEVSSIELKQFGVTYQFKGTKAKIQGIPGWLYVHGLKQLEGADIASAQIIKRALGYYLKVSYFEDLEEFPIYDDSEELTDELKFIGPDMGVGTHITLSNGLQFHSYLREQERLKRLQRKRSRQVKGSSNYVRTCLKIKRCYERLQYLKKEYAQRVINYLKQFDIIFFQDENLRAWARRWNIHHSALGTIKAMLKKLPNAVMLSRWVATTQWCPKCETKTKHNLKERVFRCKNEKCDYSAPRDFHAANNMIWLGFKLSRNPETAHLVSGTPEVLGNIRTTHVENAITAHQLRYFAQLALIESDLERVEYIGAGRNQLPMSFEEASNGTVVAAVIS